MYMIFSDYSAIHRRRKVSQGCEINAREIDKLFSFFEREGEETK